MLLKGKIAIITGSAGGIGHGIATRLADQGAHVVLTSRSVERGRIVAQEIEETGGAASCRRFVLEDVTSGEELIDSVVAEHGRLDILINNAVSHPTLPPMPLEAMTHAQLQEGISTNLTNVLTLTSRAFPHLEKVRGCVLNIGSVAVNRNMLGIPLYTILKGALTQMTKVLAAEWAAAGVRVNQINPGAVQSEALRNIGIPDEYVAPLLAHYQQYHPLGRLGTPDDIGSLAGFMVSDDAAWMTGAVVDMDGGYSVQGVPVPQAET